MANSGTFRLRIYPQGFPGPSLAVVCGSRRGPPSDIKRLGDAAGGPAELCPGQTVQTVLEAARSLSVGQEYSHISYFVQGT